MKITTALEKYLTASRKFERTKERRFYLSDMGKCFRMRWLKRKGISSEFAVSTLWLFQMGDLAHDFGYKALESQGLLLDSEGYIKTEHFSGKFDGKIKHEGKEAVFDFKTAKSYKIKKVIDGYEDDTYIAQLLSYPLLLAEGGEKNISKSAFLVYINKEPDNKQGVPPFFQREYHLTTKRGKDLKAEMDSLVEFWLDDKIPPCSCPGWMKDYNTFQPLCEMDEKGIRRVLKGLEKGKRYVTTKTALYLLEGERKKEVAKVK